MEKRLRTRHGRVLSRFSQDMPAPRPRQCPVLPGPTLAWAWARPSPGPGPRLGSKFGGSFKDDRCRRHRFLMLCCAFTLIRMHVSDQLAVIPAWLERPAVAAQRRGAGL
eukprot:gene13246-biopygen8003